MLPKILPKDKFNEFVGFLMKQARVAAPVAKGPAFAFSVIDTLETVQEIRMDYDVTILPPKKYLVPQHEDLAWEDASIVAFVTDEDCHERLYSDLDDFALEQVLSLSFKRGRVSHCRHTGGRQTTFNGLCQILI